MGIPDGAHTHGHGSGRPGGAGVVLLVILAAALLGPAVAAAAAALLHALLIAAVLILDLAAVGVVALVAYRVRQARPEPPRVVHRITPAPWRPAQALPEPRPAMGRPTEVHLHLHGVTPADIAAILDHRDE
jgi:hypothetical protein